MKLRRYPLHDILFLDQVGPTTFMLTNTMTREAVQLQGSRWVLDVDPDQQEVMAIGKKLNDEDAFFLSEDMDKRLYIDAEGQVYIRSASAGRDVLPKPFPRCIRN